MSELTLTAQSVGRNDSHARITVFQNGALAGVLTVEAEHEEVVIQAISQGAAAPDLLEACKKVLHAIAWSDTDERLPQSEQAAILEAAIAKAEGRVQ